MSGMTVTEHPISVLEYKQEVVIDAPREKVFEVVTGHIGGWFTPRFIEGASVVSEPWVGGRIYEDDGNGAGVLWDICTGYIAPSYASYESPWGFADGAATIVVTYNFAEADDGAKTKLTSKHKIIGYISPESRAGYESHLATPEMSLETLLNTYMATLS